MKKEIPMSSFLEPADRPTSFNRWLKSRLGLIKQREIDTPLTKDRLNEAVENRNLLNKKRQYLNLQYKITRKLLKPALPSQTIIEQARELGLLVKSSDEEMSGLKLISDQEIAVARFGKLSTKTIPLKFGPERRIGPVDRRKYDYHISKDRRNEETDRRSLLNYTRQYLSFQYRITLQLIKAISPSNQIIELAYSIGRIIKISEEELSELKLILKPLRS